MGAGRCPPPSPGRCTLSPPGWSPLSPAGWCPLWSAGARFRQLAGARFHRLAGAAFAGWSGKPVQKPCVWRFSASYGLGGVVPLQGCSARTQRPSPAGSKPLRGGSCAGLVGVRYPGSRVHEARRSRSTLCRSSRRQMLGDSMCKSVPPCAYGLIIPGRAQLRTARRMQAPRRQRPAGFSRVGRMRDFTETDAYGIPGPPDGRWIPQLRTGRTLAVNRAEDPHDHAMRDRSAGRTGGHVRGGRAADVGHRARHDLCAGQPAHRDGRVVCGRSALDGTMTRPPRSGPV